jgi:voltage-gated potassium channel
MSAHLNNPLRALRKLIYIVFGIVAFGTSGYMMLESYTFIDALYMTIQTVSTVGFNEVREFTGYGKEFTIFLIVSSFGTFAFGISQLTQIIIDGSLQTYLKTILVQNKIDQLSNHVIICGFGRNGKQAAKKIAAYKQAFIVIDKILANIEEGKKEFPDLLYIHGDATHDDILELARIGEARALISALHNDADNLFVVVSARQMNPKMRIVSRANENSTEKKLISAGANYTVSPNLVGGSHLAHNLMKPDVVEFLERIDIGGNSTSYIEEVLVNDLPEIKKDTHIRDLEIRQLTGCNIIGYKSQDGDFVINPGADLVLQPNSKLFVLGDDSQITRLKKFINE